MTASLLLTDAPLHAPLRVLQVTSPDASPDWADRLAEIGFLPGEPVTVIARAQPGGDPLAVRVGLSTFALRRAEAACIRVTALTEGG